MCLIDFIILLFINDPMGINLLLGFQSPRVVRLRLLLATAIMLLSSTAGTDKISYIRILEAHISELLQVLLRFMFRQVLYQR